jgi:hypothetical protein
MPLERGRNVSELTSGRSSPRQRAATVRCILAASGRREDIMADETRVDTGIETGDFDLGLGNGPEPGDEADEEPD